MKKNLRELFPLDRGLLKDQIVKKIIAENEYVSYVRDVDKHSGPEYAQRQIPSEATVSASALAELLLDIFGEE